MCDGGLVIIVIHILVLLLLLNTNPSNRYHSTSRDLCSGGNRWCSGVVMRSMWWDGSIVVVMRGTVDIGIDTIFCVCCPRIVIIVFE